MKNYNVHWCDIHNTYGGMLTVEAHDEHEADVKARNVLKMGCNLFIVKIEEFKA